MMRFSIVIATHNRCGLLRRTLPTVLDFDYPPGDFEVIVVVDGSSDGTAAYLDSLRPSCGFKLLQQPNRGQAFAINAGLRAASGEVVLFLDDDILCPPDLLRHYDAAHRQYPNCIVFGPVFTSSDSPGTASAHLRRSGLSANFSTLTQEDAEFRFCAGNANTSAPRAALLAVGGMDESFVGARDDADLGVRLWLHGLRFKYCPAARVEEVYVNSPADVVRDMLLHGRNEVRLCRKYPVYAAHSFLHKVVARRKGRLLLVWLATWLRFILDPALALAGRIGAATFGVDFAFRMLNVRVALAFYWSAAREAGGFRKLLAIAGNAGASAGSQAQAGKS